MITLSVDSVKDANTLVQALSAATRFVPQIHWYEVIFVSSFVPQSVYHKLGVTPIGMVFDAFTDAVVWAEPSDRQEWGDQRVMLRCNAENAKVRVGLIT